MVRKTSLVSLVNLIGGDDMLQVNILEAKTEFSKLIRLLETRREDAITVARNGKPVARITLINETPVSKRIGVGKGRFSVSGDFDADNDAIANLMTEGGL